MPDRRVIHIPKGEPLCSYTITRISPYDLAEDVSHYEAVDLTFKVHASVREWLFHQAEYGVEAGNTPTTYMDIRTASQDIQTITPLDLNTEGDTEGHKAWNLHLSDVVSREATPSLRFDQEWTHHLAFIRMAVNSLERTLRIQLRTRLSESLFTPRSLDDGHNGEIEKPLVEANLAAAFGSLRHQHIPWPKTSRTTIQLAT